jgi:competence protein ComEA
MPSPPQVDERAEAPRTSLEPAPFHSHARPPRAPPRIRPTVLAMAGTDARWRLGAGAAVLLVLGAVAGGVAQRMVADAQPAAVLPTPVATAAAELVVDVQGAVAEPGVYRLAQGSRVLDALARAGGTTDAAAPGALNLARALVDGEQLLVPTEEEQAAAAEAAPGAGGVAAGGLVSLNRADQTTLETLPRVGPSLAGAIIAHRDEHGPFTDLAQLDDVPGIGPALLATLTPLVTL